MALQLIEPARESGRHECQRHSEAAQRETVLDWQQQRGPHNRFGIIEFCGPYYEFPENIDGGDVHSYLRETLPKLTGITFDPPLEFQRLHRLGPKQRDDANRPRPIIACLLRHVQTRQLLQADRAHSPFRLDDLEVRLMADFSKETSERRRAFLSLRPCLRLHLLDVKYGLFEPARMWITKNGVSRDFCDPDDLQVFQEGLQNQTQSMDTASSIRSQDPPGPLLGAALSIPAPDDMGRTTVGSHPRGRDLEILMKSHDNRGEVL
ncbi:hypothetical protein NDU88_004432 [Pleurodeles waltl]|uniref:Uncharacterized protein n=1 Tax=Pleurodeles waltl TaxID=8319 RepID=A0AAV7L1G1_PLEWA|nr:hypothetical protein NDU88_004432 [Pleurodeles waltl]